MAFSPDGSCKQGFSECYFCLGSTRYQQGHQGEDLRRTIQDLCFVLLRYERVLTQELLCSTEAGHLM